MPSRVTQLTRVTPVDSPAGGGAARVTQLSRVAAVNVATAALGGAARVTQVARVVVGTIDLGSGNAPMLRGMV